MSSSALLIVDMQEGLFSPACHGSKALVQRLADLAARLRDKRLPIIFIQHCGSEDHPLHPSAPGHAIVGGLPVQPGDLIIKKRFCDSFLETPLASTLSELELGEVIITGCATEFCVDTTIRSALARGFATVVPEDGHTTFDRENVSARMVIEHHNALWANFISPAGAARLTRCEDIV
jgi:nicotinamidase-related amidase